MTEDIHRRLREISDEIVALRMYILEEPANELVIELLEIERKDILKEVIRLA